MIRGSGDHGTGGGGARALGILSAAATDRDVAEGPTVSPVAAAGLAEVTRLREVVVVVVAELGIGGLAPRAREVLLLRRWSSETLGLGGSPVVRVARVRRHLG